MNTIVLKGTGPGVRITMPKNVGRVVIVSNGKTIKIPTASQTSIKFAA